MKIITQTSDEMVLTDGGAGGLVLGIILILIGGYVGFTSTLLIGAIVVLAGLTFVLLNSRITIDFTKQNDQIQYTKKRLIGSRSATYPMSNALRVEIRKQWYRMRGTSVERLVSTPRLIAQSILVLKDGTELALENSKYPSTTITGVLMSGQGKEVAIANQVATFLSVPFQEIQPPNAGLNVNIAGSAPSIQL